jgi:hypothetical protein
MSASPSTKLQVNFKLADGTLVNIYADNVKELETSLNDIGMVAALIKATSNDLGGAPARSAESIAAQFNAPAAPQPVAVTSSGGAYTCKHGAMTFRQSKPGAPKEWKGYFCPTPQGTADQCEPKFLRG